MIQPREEVPGEGGHPAWKLNVFIAIIVSVVGAAMMASVALIVYGTIVLALGIAWAVVACIIGLRQERRAPEGTQLPRT